MKTKKARPYSVSVFTQTYTVLARGEATAKEIAASWYERKAPEPKIEADVAEIAKSAVVEETVIQVADFDVFEPVPNPANGDPCAATLLWQADPAQIPEWTETIMLGSGYEKHEEVMFDLARLLNDPDQYGIEVGEDGRMAPNRAHIFTVCGNVTFESTTDSE